MLEHRNTYRAFRISGWGCFWVVALAGIVFYFLFVKDYYAAFYKLSPVFLLIAMLLNWRVVFGILVALWRLSKVFPFAALLAVIFIVLALPFFSVFLIFVTSGVQALIHRFEQEIGTYQEKVVERMNAAEEEYIDYEEVKESPPPKDETQG